MIESTGYMKRISSKLEIFRRLIIFPFLRYINIVGLVYINLSVLVMCKHLICSRFTNVCFFLAGGTLIINITQVTTGTWIPTRQEGA